MASKSISGGKSYENLFSDGQNVIVFGGEEEAPRPGAPGLAAPNPLEKLKAIILSIEWEINEAILDEYIKETDRLASEHKGDQVVLYFLKMLNSAGSYIRNRMEDAHPETIRLLIAIYNNFETVFLTPDMPEAEKKKVLKEQIERFSELKDKIKLAKEAAGRRQAEAAQRQAARRAEAEAKAARTTAQPDVSPAPVPAQDTPPPPREFSGHDTMEFVHAQSEARSFIAGSDDDEEEAVAAITASPAGNAFEAAINAALSEAASASPIIPANPALSPEAQAIAEAVTAEMKKFLTRELAALRSDLTALLTGRG